MEMTPKLKIFIIEDNSILRAEYCMLAGKLDYEYKSTVGVRKPVEEILKYQPHIALLDTKLPGTTGWQICRELVMEKYIK